MPPDLRLGSRRFDLAHRVLVLAPLDGSGGPDALLRTAGGAVAAGADLLVVSGFDGDPDEAHDAVEALVSRFEVPVVIATARPEVLRAAAKGGAVAAEDATGSADPAFLGAAADHGMAVIIGSPVAAGFHTDEVVVAAALDQVGALAAAGHPVLVADPGDDPLTWRAVAALAVSRGARLVRTTDVAATVKVVRMLERILSA
jgi:dihydropteroate synthase